ncbi:MAG: DUF3097 domain-containing protein [Acidimicrobiia bacterium]|nr:DUF3097 domain-containing protein [Acidimicrobiia bacterium]
MRDDGILAGPLDLDATTKRGLARRSHFVEIGSTLTHRGSETTGVVIEFVEGRRIVLRDRSGRDHEFRPVDGLFTTDGIAVALRAPRAKSDRPSPRRTTASGSVDAGRVPARVARASRIWVEGIHDAELIERIWGDDLRVEAVVVEQLEGADDLAARVRGFRPGDRRRLGVLLDHLVDGSKESRIAASVREPDVLICGHPYVDIWQAIKPATIGIEAWPIVPKGQPWKTGVLDALGVRDEPGRFWRQALGRVESYRDVETPLINAVERLIDFVTRG